MAITAENLAVKYNVTREECDKFALLSQQRWDAANKAGKFKNEIVPVMIKVKGKEVAFEVDEHPKPDTTYESLARLNPVFKKDGVVTAGNASGVNDGAAALILASEDAVKKHNLKPLARVVGYTVNTKCFMETRHNCLFRILVDRCRSDHHGHRTSARHSQGVGTKRTVSA